MVWNYYSCNKFEYVFYDYNEKLSHPYICISKHDIENYLNGNKFNIATWKNAEPIQQPKQITKDEIKKAFDCAEFEIID